MNVIRSLLVWLCFIPVAILNGGLRQYVLVRWFGEVGANALSGVLLSLFILFCYIVVLTYWVYKLYGVDIMMGT